METTVKMFVYQHGNKNSSFTVTSSKLPIGEPQALITSNGNTFKAASKYIRKREPKASITFVGNE